MLLRPPGVISVVLPTIRGRREYLEAAKAAYAATTVDYELIVVPDKPTCGVAWVEGASKASGSYLHFSADDLRPILGWQDAATEVVHRGFLPAPRILNDDGTLQSCGGDDGWETERPTGWQTNFSRIPFLSRSQWERVADTVSPILQETHYYTDNAISFAANRLGILTGVHRGYAFHHSLAEPGRGAGTSWQNRMQQDWERFRAWAESLA